jgi:hypothetical protein
MTTFSDIGYSGQRLNNHEYRIKIRVGSDINNATGDGVCGELFLETGAAAGSLTTGKLYIATETSTTSSSSLYKIADLPVGNHVT